MEGWRRRLIVIVGFIEALLFSGCLFGWASLVHVLQQEGIYSHLCEPQQEVGLRSVEPNNEMSARLMSPNSDDTLTGTDFSTELFGTTTPFVDVDVLGLDTTFYYLTNITGGEKLDFLREDQEGYREIVRCPAQDKQFTLVYTVAAVMYGLTSILIGFSLDHFGLWVTRISASVMASAGFLCLAFAAEDSSWLLWPALNLLALGTNQLRLSCFQFANLYPKHRSTILLLYGAAYSISTVIFLVVQYGYEAGFSYKACILVLGSISIMTFPVTFLMPRMKIEDEQIPERLNTKLDTNSNEDFEKGRSEWTPSLNEKDYAAVKKQPAPIPLGASFWTLSSFLHCCWFFINSFLVLFYSASFNTWAKKTTSDLNEVAFYNKMMGLCQLIAPIFIPIAGLVTDCLIKRGSRHEDKVERLAATLEAPAYTLILSTTCAAAMLACKMFVTREAIYVSLVVIAITRPLLVGSASTYIRIRFHAEHFNRLNGIYGTLASIFCVVQYPVFVWMYSSDQNFLTAHLVLMGLLVLSYASPIHLLFRSLSRTYATAQLAQKLEADKNAVFI